MTTRPKLQALTLLFTLWGILVGGGMLLLNRYENSPSSEGRAPAQWPQETGLVLAERTPTLMLFVHPHCPCTNATVGELERLVAQLGDGLVIHVVFLHPGNMPMDWHQTALWARVCSIPSARVIDDLGCKLTHRFGVATSGEAYLYGASGKLLFAGGITRARGHSGDSPGRAAILSLISNEADLGEVTPSCCSVYGCPLFEISTAQTATREP